MSTEKTSVKHVYWNVSYTYTDKNGALRQGSTVLDSVQPYFSEEAFNFIQDKVGTENVVILSVSNLGEMTKEEWEGVNEQVSI